jgi:hypothetical protein
MILRTISSSEEALEAASLEALEEVPQLATTAATTTLMKGSPSLTQLLVSLEVLMVPAKYVTRTILCPKTLWAVSQIPDLFDLFPISH